MIEYEARPERSTYFPGEEIKIRLRVVNRGAGPVSLPDPKLRAITQPVHSLVGPGFPEGVRFSNHAVLSTSEPILAGSPGSGVVVEPGKSWSGVFSLTSVLSVSALGEYRLGSRLVVEGAEAASADARFTVAPLAISSVHVGLGTRPHGSAEGEGAFLHQEGGGRWLYTFTFLEVAPAIGETTVDRPIRRIAVGSEATDVTAPFRSSPFFDEFLRWIVWREDGALKAIHSATVEPLSVELPFSGARIVRPALKRRGGKVEVLALSEGGDRLALASFTAEPRERRSEAKLEWVAPLPEEATKAVGIVVALARENLGGARHVALTTNTPEGVLLWHGRLAEGGGLGPLQAARYEPPRRHGASPSAHGPPTPRLLERTQPAIHVDARGDAHVTAVVLHEGRVLLVEARFRGEGGEPPPVTVTELSELSAVKPVHGAVLYVDDAEGVLTRREAVLALDAKRAVYWDGRNLSPVHLDASLTEPLLLAPGKEKTYLLYFEPSRGPRLEHL